MSRNTICIMSLSMINPSEYNTVHRLMYIFILVEAETLLVLQLIMILFFNN